MEDKLLDYYDYNQHSQFPYNQVLLSDIDLFVLVGLFKQKYQSIVQGLPPVFALVNLPYYTRPCATNTNKNIEVSTVPYNFSRNYSVYNYLIPCHESDRLYK